MKGEYKSFLSNENQTSKNSEEILLTTTKAKKYIIKKLKETKIFNQTKNLDELIGPFLEIKISHFYILK